MSAQLVVTASLPGPAAAAAGAAMLGADGFGVADFVENFDVIVGAGGGVEQLRGLILNLAIRGRLGTLDAGDTPAGALVERAAQELGKIRRPRSLAVAPGVAYDLPTGWVWCEPQELGVVSPRNDVDDDMLAGFVPMTTVPTDYRRAVVPDARRWGEIKKGYTHVADGDIVVAKITPCFQNGKSCVMRDLPNGVGAGTTELLVLRPVPSAVEPNYLLLFFKSPDFVAGGVALMTGTAGQQRVPTDYFAAVRVPLPPLAEQKRIVAKVDQLMALCDDLEARQTKKRETGTRLTKSALEALTSAEDPEMFDAAWTRVVENFDVLIDRSDTVGELRKTVVALALQGRLGSSVTRDESASEGGVDAIDVDGVDLDNHVLGTLPPLWRWVPLETLLAEGPKNGYSPKGVDYETPVKSLTLTATTSGRFDGQHFKYIDEQIPPDSDLWLRDGDVLIQRGNTIEYVGVAAVYRGPAQTFIYPDLMMKVRFTANADTAFAHMALNGPVARRFVKSRASGTSGSMPKINQATVRSIPIPLPPLDEQLRIVAKVAQIMTRCDELELQLRRGEEHAARLAAAAVRGLVA